MSPGAAWPGAEVSRCDVPHHRVGQRLIGHQPLQPTVLALQCFQPLGLVDPQPPVLPPPAVIRWLGHAEAARDLRDRFPLREHHLRLPQFADDLLGRVPLACHADSLRTGPNPRTGSGPVLGGQVTFTSRGSVDADEVVLVATTSGRRIAARFALAQSWDESASEQMESVVLALPDLPNLPAWFRAFLADIHEHDPDRVPHPPPRLGSPSDWYTPVEKAIEARTRAIEDEIQQLEDERVQLESDLAAEGETADAGIRRAIWVEGDDLVDAVSEILQKLGFSVQDMDACRNEDEPRHEDLRLTHTGYPDWEAIVEVKGYVNGIRTNDARQIREHRDHYIREKKRPPDLTLWLANPFRQMEPSSRPAPDKGVNDAAEIAETVCALTKDLYRQWVFVTMGSLQASDVVKKLVDAVPGLWAPTEPSHTT